MPLPRRRQQPLFDTQDYSVETQYCANCNSHFARVTGYVHEPDGATLAVYYAVCHGHPEHEVALDLILGTWGDDASGDHETFSCLMRTSGVTAVDPFVTLYFDGAEELPALLGRPMSREDALGSPDIQTVWAIVDALAVTVGPIIEQMQGSAEKG